MNKLKIVLLVFLGFLMPASAQAGVPTLDSIKLTEGYSIEPYVADLNKATAAFFDGGDLLIGESGSGRILKVTGDGQVEVVISNLNSPITSLLKVDDKLLIAHKGKVSSWDGKDLKDIVLGLSGESVTKLTLDPEPDKKIFLGQGTVTKTGLFKADKSADVPCQDITLASKEVIKGDIKCSSGIFSFNEEGTNLEFFAWGVYDLSGMQFDKKGQLWTVSNNPSYLFKVEKDSWYGWPEVFKGRAKSPAVTLTTQAKGLAFSTGGNFGFEGEIFTGGEKIVRIDPKSKQVSFAEGFKEVSDIFFGPEHGLYIVDSDTIWRIYKSDSPALRGVGPILASKIIQASEQPQSLFSRFKLFFNSIQRSLHSIIPIPGLR